jgi:hypothetical protein
VQPLDLAVRREIYNGPMNGAAIPRKANLAALLDVSAAEVEGSLSSLADAHMIVLEPETGEVLMANPFSAVPTPFLVTAGGQSWYGNCIWDSMGIAAMIGRKVTVSSSCGCCGAAITLDVPDDCDPADPRLAHFAIPAAHWWDDIVFN